MANNSKDVSLPSLATVIPSRGQLLRVAKLVLKVAVLAAVGWHVWELTEDWRAKQAAGEISVVLHWGWVAAAVGAYVAGQCLYATFWRSLLADADIATSPVEGLRAFAVGTMGKYVPGKALVVVLRTALIRVGDRSRIPVALSVLYETVTMMALGALLAAMCLAVAEPGRWIYWGPAAGVGAGLAVVLYPPMFRRFSRMVSKILRRAEEDLTPRYRPATLARGAVLVIAAWSLLGLSLVAVTRAIGAEYATTSDLFLVIGTAPFGTVAGFLALIMPAGVGVREYFVMELLAPRLGGPAAAGASLLLRLVWVVAEATLAGALYCWPVRRREP